MESETKNEELIKRASEIAEGRTGADSSGKVNEAAQRESPLDEVRRLNKETKELVGELGKIRDDLNNLAAFTALSGKAVAGNRPAELTPEEAKKKTVDDLAKMLTSAYIR